MIFRIVFLAVWVTLLVGCASVVAPRGSSETDIESQPPEKNATAPKKSPEARQPDKLIIESDAVKYLLDNAERALSLEDYSRARALADRALRIERTAARAYLVLARVELGYGDLLKAEDYARQGLLYVSEDTPVGRSLLDLVADSMI